MELTDKQLEIIADKVAEKLAEREIEVNQLPDLLPIPSQGSYSVKWVSEVEELSNWLTEKAKIQEASQDHISNSENIEKKNQNCASIELSLEENEILEILANKKNETKNQVLRKAIALMNLAVQAGELGLQLGIGKEGYIDTEIVGL